MSNTEFRVGGRPVGGPKRPTSAPLPDDAPLRAKVEAAIRRVYDPEIPVNIYDLGLIYKLDVNEESGRVVIDMTLTTPNCPEAESIPGRVRAEVESVPRIKEAHVNIVWDPPWDKSKMSEDARLLLGLD
ncbi:MAG: iron-sulfur cluster assembly protein [Phycisphaeraceae bacterium]